MKKDRSKQHPADHTSERQGGGLSMLDSADALLAFVRGEDVGHGVDHDCPQCRRARHALATPLVEDVASQFKRVPNSDPLVTESGNQVTGVLDPSGLLEANADYIAEAHRVHGDAQLITALSPAFDGLISGDGSGVALPPIDMSGAADARQGESWSDLDDRLNHALAQAFKGQGMSPVRGDSSEEIIDELHLLDDKIAVMLMRGFVPEDRRWHCEINTGPARAHVAHAEREIAVKIAALSVYDGAKGAAFEREFAAWEEAARGEPVQRGTPNGWTGQTQAMEPLP